MSITEITTAKRSEQNRYIWDDRGELVPLNPAPTVRHQADVAAIVVNRNRPDLTDTLVQQLQNMGQHLSMDIYVIEMGSDEDKLSQYCSLHYDDPDFRGKCYGHNVGLRLARSKGNYRYYFTLMNDLVFEEDIDSIGELVKIADANPKLAILSPTEYEGACPDGKPLPNSDFHLVSACDYLALLVRAESVNDVGFLNPDFRYCWGAIHEFAYKLYSRIWQVAYCDKVTMKHLGGTTYGKVKGTVSREEYRRKAREFAVRYFVEHYGSNWDDDFSKVLPPQIRYNFFKRVRRSWEGFLDNKENKVYPNQSILGRGKRLVKHIVAATKLLIVFDTKERRSYLSRQVSRGKTLVKQIITDATKLFPKSKLHQQIETLHPWYYEVEINGIKVTPGIGSKQSPEALRGRVRYRTKLLVDEVAKRYDFSGKRLLDIASNCGYWSARYAELGAISLLAVEGRADYVQQGWLCWRNNQFMEPGTFEFIHGNVMKRETWDVIRERAYFDFTLCLGILYHIPDYEELLRHIASVTREVVLIDTRVSDSEEFIEEPGGWCFDAIIETRTKKVPNLKRLLQLMNELGFQTERLSIDEPTPEGLKGADDYNLGNRVALLAVRSK